MRTIISILITSFGIITLCSWGIQLENPIKKAEWLIGTWENKSQKASVYETWTKINDDELFGKSYMLKEKDSIVFETISLVLDRDSLFYIPRVKNQNNDLAVRFSLKLISENNFVFENSKHDYPQTISYSRINTDSLVAVISGIKNQQMRNQTFPMKRIKK